jgi:hypothetical protein
MAQDHAALIHGDIEFLASTESVLAFRRFDAHGAVLAAFQTCRVKRRASRCPAFRCAKRSAVTGCLRALLLTLPCSFLVTALRFLHSQHLDFADRVYISPPQ